MAEQVNTSFIGKKGQNRHKRSVSLDDRVDGMLREIAGGRISDCLRFLIIAEFAREEARRAAAGKAKEANND